MTTPQPHPTSDGLFLWVMNRFAEVFEEHAIIKGGMALRLFDCPRSTTDIDYLFVPYRSKKDILGRVEEVLSEIEGAEIRVDVHSKMIRAAVRLGEAAIQVEATVATDCESSPVSTGGFATSLGQPPRVVRVMEHDLALAHKLAAWNERRLIRDLYDCYYLATRLGGVPQISVLERRLEKIQSRLPILKGRKSMTLGEFAEELHEASVAITDEALQQELGPVIPIEELAGLKARMRAAIVKIAELLL